MTEAAKLRPRFRPDVRLSGPLLAGGTWVHLMLDPVTKAQMRIGRKEHFIVSRLDGVHTLEQIGLAYADRFGTRLGDQQWQQLLGLLYGRALMADGPSPLPATEPAAPRLTIATGTFLLVKDAGRLVGRLAAVTRFLRRPLAWALLLAAAGTVLAGIAVHLPELGWDVRALPGRPLALIAVVVAVWLSCCLHEVAHGLAGQAMGGTVEGIGVRWRLPAAWLYCSIPDLRFMAPQARQVAAAGAGVLANVLALAPAYVAWLLVPAGSARITLGAVLLVGALAGLVNLIPVPPLDGFKIIECGLGVIGLSASLVPGCVRGPYRWLYRLAAATCAGILGGLSLLVIAVIAGVTAVPAVCVLAAAALCLAALVTAAARVRPPDA